MYSGRNFLYGHLIDYIPFYFFMLCAIICRDNMLCYVDTYIESIVFVFLGFVFGITSALYISEWIIIQIIRLGSCCYCIQLEVLIFNFSLFYEKRVTGVYEVLSKVLTWKVCMIWEKQWEEHNVHFWKVFVRNVYHLFHICGFCHCSFFTISTGNRNLCFGMSLFCCCMYMCNLKRLKPRFLHCRNCRLYESSVLSIGVDKVTLLG